jgi:hypothetical protein
MVSLFKIPFLSCKEAKEQRKLIQIAAVFLISGVKYCGLCTEAI